MPYEAARKYNELERFGMIIIVAFLATGLFGKIIMPLVYASYSGLLWVFVHIMQIFAA